MEKRINVIWTIQVATFLTFGLLGIIQNLLGYQNVKFFLDRISKGGEMLSFTPMVYQTFTIPLLILGIIFFGLGIATILLADRSKKTILKIWQIGNKFIRVFIADTKTFWKKIITAPSGKEKIILITIISLYGLLFRWMFINRAVEYDEAYTYIEFARHTLKWIMTSYYVVNNHIFQTILVHFSTLIFGNELWAIRLPSLIAGVATIYLVYLLGSKLYGKYAGYLSAVITACAPVQILISTKARGYSIISLLALTIILISIYLSKKPNLFAWFMLALLNAIGFYTIPVMLYPTGFALTWLLVNRLFKKNRNGLKIWLFEYIGSVGLFGLFSLIFYTPVLLNPDNALVKGVQAYSINEFFSRFEEMLTNIGSEWTIGIYPAVGILLILGMLMTLIFHRKISIFPHFPMAGILFGTFAVFLLIQRPNLVERSTFWMIPFICIWGSAGVLFVLNYLINFLPKRTEKRRVWVNAFFIVGVGLLGFLYPFRVDRYSEKWSEPYAEGITLSLKSMVTEQDVVVASTVTDAPYWYYFDYYKIPQSVIRGVKTRPFQRAFVIVAPSETLETVVKNFGPDSGFLDMKEAVQVIQSGGITVFEIPGRMDNILKAFPQKN